jgi:bacterioferritin-associated ferredoxin
MYVCVCRAVTDKQVRAALEGGAETLEAVRAACSAGGDCGGCHGVIEEMIQVHLEDKGVIRRLPIIGEDDRGERAA